MAFDFHTARESFSGVIESLLLESLERDDDKGKGDHQAQAPGGGPVSVQRLEDTYNDFPGSDVEKKSALDQALRDVLLAIIQRKGTKDEFLGVVTLSAGAVQSEMCSPSTLFVLLQDIFDCFTLDKCEDVFTFLENRVSLWKSDTYYNAGKNYLLRMCNDLLRRLSRSKNTVFCGRIQLFLARLFPLSEKSGLNIMSQFNLDNVTIYNTKAEDYEPVRKDSLDERDESMEFEEGETADQPSNIPIDYNLYRKFWSLQDYFRRPTQCYDKDGWKTFMQHSEDVLLCFESYKLEDSKPQHRGAKDDKRKSIDSIKDVEMSEDKSPTDDGVYFAKYLTSEKLLDLQLSDSNFRRSMLIQLLIVFQYLQAQVRFKSSTQVLTDEQISWIKDTTERVLKALRETHPDGDQFATTIEHILSREDNWNNWKNDNCPSFIRSAGPSKESARAGLAKKRSIGDDLKASGGKLIKMGNSELTRLWNICPDNMQACRTENRVILPSLEEFFEEAIEQMDPEAMIEDEYKLIKKSTWAWKALRLLSRRSPNFFSQPPNATQKKKSVPEYLEAMLAKLAKEMPSSSSQGETGEIKTEVEDDDSGGPDDQLGGKDEVGEDKNDSQAPSTASDEASQEVTKEQLALFAQKLAGDWKKLATELGFPDDDITYLENETDEREVQALKMLTLWKENEADPITVEVMRSSLTEVGLEAIATDVFGDRTDA